MTDTFYRARLTLERVEPYTNKYDNLSERTTEISAHTVTGATPADAMYQIHDHAGTLYDWHQQAEDDNPPVLDEAVRLGSPLLDLTKVFKHLMGPQRHRCAICGQPGPISHEGNSYICPDCNASLDAQKAEAEQAARTDDAHDAHGTPITPPVEGAFVACKAPADWAPGHFCSGPIGHDGPCDYVPADQLPDSAGEEGADEPAFVEVLLQPDEHTVPVIPPPAGNPIITTSPPYPKATMGGF